MNIGALLAETSLHLKHRGLKELKCKCGCVYVCEFELITSGSTSSRSSSRPTCVRCTRFPWRQVSELGSVQMHIEHNSLKGLLFRVETPHSLHCCVCLSALYSYLTKKKRTLSPHFSSTRQAALFSRKFLNIYVI